ncbi:MAG: c-type cytochrome, partial [Pirellulales bacterium]|nr:c-type cytochrome [Pirellulales bacterium]
PTRVLHVRSGGEYGWRRGWAKWPSYYHDGLPGVLATGAGSPTGVEVYNHHKFPARYENALFMGDWTNGRIVVVRTNESEGTVAGQAEVFLEGRPLNVTDLAVGPDGWLYFITGGRGTEGGVYRVVYNGEPQDISIGTGMKAVILQPQPQSAWSRQKVAEIKKQLGDKWDAEITAVAFQAKNRAEYRVRALELMHLYGPTPTTKQLIELSHDPNAKVRARCAYLMGIHADEEAAGRLVELLEDDTATVRRIACESIARCGALAPVDKLLAATGDKSHAVSFAARRALEQQPAQEWAQLVLTTTRHREFIVGATALLVVERNRETSQKVLDRASEIIQGYVTDRDFIDLLRVMQLALAHGKIAPDEVPTFRRQIAEEYPSSNQRINRELIRLVAYLDETSVVDRLLGELANAKTPTSEKVHIAMHAARLGGTWTSEQKLTMLKFYEKARQGETDDGLGQYIDIAARDFFKRLNKAEQQKVLADARKWPNASLAVLAAMDQDLTPGAVQQLIKLDGELDGSKTQATKRLRMGVAAVLGRSGDETAMAHIRKAYETEPDRRPTMALALATHPDGENWPVLVKALPILEGGGATFVMSQLAKVDRKPDDPEAVRQLIMLGARRATGIDANVEKLLAHWAGENAGADAKTSKDKLAAWQAWYAKAHAGAPAITVATAETHKWTYDELLKFVTDEKTAGDPTKGAMVFAKAQCAKCHRYGKHGETIGPDLSTVSRRFHTKEILQSVLYPSQVISSQYKSQKVVTDDGRLFVGIVAPRGEDSVMVLQTTGEKILIPKEHIDEIVPSRISAMPEGLLNTLTLEEVADLFAYMQSTPDAVAERPKTTRSE